MSDRIPDPILSKIHQLDAIYGGRCGDFQRVEPAIDRMRAYVSDILLSREQQKLWKEREIPKLK